DRNPGCDKSEAKFKAISEAYDVLKDPQKRAAYDRLGQHQPGQEFEPSRDWGREFDSQFNGGHASFEGVDLSDLFASFARHRGGGAGGQRANANFPVPGEDFEVAAQINLEDAYKGTQVKLELSVPTVDAHGRVQREARSVDVRIPKGATNGQRLRLRGQGGKGHNGGRDGDLYLNITLRPHHLYRVDDHDLYMDLLLAPWEAALGATVEVPTLAGMVHLKVAPGTSSGQHLRLGKRGLPKPGSGEGDLFANVKIVTPKTLTEKEAALFKELQEISTFRPRAETSSEAPNAN
ncbi:MAG: DnaJ C-terminal domain-containing protein, partial [Usitatibacteraceae bacterium]